MSDPQFTPGPWQSKPNKYQSDEWLVQAEMPTNRVLVRFGNCDELDDTDIANAHLIAAAPDLFAACEAVLASSMRNEAYDICRAALAKARGEQS